MTGLPAGTYRVTVTDDNGCTANESVTITEPTALSANAVATNVHCNGGNDGTVDLTLTGGTAPYTYVWNNSATTDYITGLAAGTYSVTVTDANGCTDTASVTVTEPTGLVASGTVDSNVSCNGSTNGGATASATGGTAPYSYNWSNGATTASITGVPAGTYTVTVTDSNGCTDTASVTILNQLLLLLPEQWIAMLAVTEVLMVVRLPMPPAVQLLIATTGAMEQPQLLLPDYLLVLIALP